MIDYTPPCAQLPIEKADKLFFSEGSAKRIAEAKAICATCKMTRECLDRSVGVEYGIFGGLTPNERLALV